MSHGSTDVCVVGLAAWDTTLAVRRVPASGEEEWGRIVGEGPGGKAANVAASAAYSGAPTVLICRLGQDPAGRRFCSVASGILQLKVAAQEARRTSAAQILLTPDGERTILNVAEEDSDPD